MIPARSVPAYYPARAAPPPPVLKKHVRFVSDNEMSSDSDSSYDHSDSDSIFSCDTETSVTSTGSWAELDVTTPPKIVPTRSILDFRNPAFGKFFDTIDVDSPEALQLASLDPVRFEANLQLILRTSNVAFPSAATYRVHRAPSRNEAIALSRAALELREDIQALGPLLGRMHRAGLDVKELAKSLRATKKLLDCLDNDEADQLERGARPVAAPLPIRPSTKPAFVDVDVSSPSTSPPRTSHRQAQAPVTHSTSPPVSNSSVTRVSAREPSPPRLVRRKPVPEAFPHESAAPAPAPPKTLSAVVIHTKTPPPASASTPPKKRNNLPVTASPSPAQPRAPVSPTHPSITIEGPTPITQAIALPATYQYIPSYPSRVKAPENVPSPKVTYQQVSWPKPDGKGGYVVPVSHGHITASHVARC